MMVINPDSVTAVTAIPEAGKTAGQGNSSQSRHDVAADVGDLDRLLVDIRQERHRLLHELGAFDDDVADLLHARIKTIHFKRRASYVTADGLTY
jgi:hypothetical protein